MIYLASPYSHPDPEVRHARYTRALEITAHLISAYGLRVFSPIVHCHPMSQITGLPGDWKFWGAYDREMIAACRGLLVACLDGWRESVGVGNEIEIAHELGRKVWYWNVDDDS